MAKKPDPSKSLCDLAGYLASRVNVREGSSHACADLIEKGVGDNTLLAIGYSSEVIEDAHKMIEEWEAKRKAQAFEKKMNDAQYSINRITEEFFDRIKYVSKEDAADTAQTLARRYEAAVNRYLGELNLARLYPRNKD